ncbi:MAG: hypothetical protein ACTSUE_00460 [Promethearchaeota archaeon]
MEPPFPSLSSCEKSFLNSQIFTIAADQNVLESDVNAFAADIARYNSQLNRALKEYPSISYKEDPNGKLIAKAAIKYAYDFLDLLLDIMKNLEVVGTMTEKMEGRIQLLDEFIWHKEILIQSTYIPAARDELEAFHDPNKRKHLEEKLSRMLKKKDA